MKSRSFGSEDFGERMEQVGVESNLKWPQGVKLEPGGEGIIDVIPSGIIIASYELPRSLLTEVEHTA